MSGTCTTLDLTPACVNLRLYAGDGNNLQMQVEQGGTLVDITGWTFTASARKTVADPTAAVAATCAVTDGPMGLVEIAWGDLRTLLAAETSWEGVWDVQAQPTGGDVKTLAAGTLTVVLDVTRP